MPFLSSRWESHGGRERSQSAVYNVNIVQLSEPSPFRTGMKRESFSTAESTAGDMVACSVAVARKDTYEEFLGR